MNEPLTRLQFDLLTLSVAATLLAHLAHLPLWLSLPVAILLPLRAWTRRRGANAVGIAIRLPLTLVLVALVIVSFGNLFGREPGSVLGCGLLALKLLETERPRDARVALGFAAFVLMSALLFTQTLPFTLMICAILVLLVASLAALQPAPSSSRAPMRAPFTLALALLGVGLPLAAAAFVLVPRLGSPLWGSPGNDSMARTGLGERMAPGSLTDLLIDDSPAFRVAFDSSVPLPTQRYFRAIVMWDFDGTAWTRDRLRNAPRIEDVRDPSGLIDYTVTLEATDRRWLPSLDVPMTTPESARLGADRVLVANDAVSAPRQYHVQSATRYTLAPVLSGAERVRALALPKGFDPKSLALAQQWRNEGRDDAGVVRAALDLFHASFTYTLSPPLLGRDSIDDFLFDTRRGFCEHYSSAFVFLMRAAGIPARVVTGYQGGWWNASGNYLLVRQSDAHAWAEIWTADHGWQRVDPTAAVSPARVELGAAAANGNASWSQADWIRDLRNQLDVVNQVWTKGIIGFNALRQKGMLTSFGMVDPNQGDLMLILAGVLGVVMLLATVWAMSGRARPRGDALDRGWARLGRRFARRGLAARDDEGPLDWLQRVRRSRPDLAAELGSVVDEYVALRYGTTTPPAQRIARFARRVRAFRLPRFVKT